MEDMQVTGYDGCGKCFVGVRRLSRKSDATSSPEKQMKQVLRAVNAVGGHVIAWADDWEVSGATDPLTRPRLGPWLREEMGPYSGIAGSAVDRIGRNQRDVLNTGYMIKDCGRLLVTYGHDGPWNLDDPGDEMRFSMEAFGAQMELRAIQKRNRDATAEARAAGRPKQKNSYGYRFVRLVPTGKVDHVEIDPVAASVIRDVAQRILTDESGMISCATEAARLTREGIPSPSDHRAKSYGREPKGSAWSGKSLYLILISEAALGYLMHKGRPVVGADGHPVRLAEELWDRATRDALIAKTAPQRRNDRAPRGTYLLTQVAFCGVCEQRLYITDGSSAGVSYSCIGRKRGIPASATCKPGPSMRVGRLNKLVEDTFLGEYGHIPLMRREFDPGTGSRARVADLEADRSRLREDRQAGLYDDPDDAAWFRKEYQRMSEELRELRKLPDRPSGWHWVQTGKTLADQWHEAPDDAARRELLADYHIKAVLYPQGSRKRAWIHGLDPETEYDARVASMEAEELSADLADELAYWREHDQAASEEEGMIRPDYSDTAEDAA